MNRYRKKKENLICGLVAVCFLLVTGWNSKAGFVFGEPENLGPMVNSAHLEEYSAYQQMGLSFTSRRTALVGMAVTIFGLQSERVLKMNGVRQQILAP